MIKKKNYNKSAKSSAMKTRGGFLPAAPPTAFMRKGKMMMNMTPDPEKRARKHIKVATNPEAQARRELAYQVASDIIFRVAKKAFQNVLDPEGLGNGTKFYPAVTSESIAGSPSPSSALGRRFKTLFEAGKPSSKTINRLAQQVGTEKIVNFNSEAGVTPTIRSEFACKWGFNQKLVKWFAANGIWTDAAIQEVFDPFSLLPETARDRTDRAYWSVKHFGMTYKLYNQNKFLKTKVKISLVSLDTLKSADAAVQSLFTLDPLLDQGNGAIPRALQYSGISYSVGSGMDSVLVDPKLGNWRKADNFTSQFKFVKSFTKVLEPGEVWEFDYRHHMGSGFRLDELLSRGDLGVPTNYTPLFLPIFEFSGLDCELSDSIDPTISYIGTSSGSVQMEVKRYAEIVKAESSTDDYKNLDPDFDGYFSGYWNLRVFQDEPVRYVFGQSGPSSRFNIDYADILRAGEAAAAGKYFIPVSTDLTIARGGKEAVAN